MENPGFEQWPAVGFSKLTSTEWEIPRELSHPYNKNHMKSYLW